jgi:hypothetical protein
MRPDATSPFPSPFSAIAEAEWLCANDLAFGIFDSFAERADDAAAALGSRTTLTSSGSRGATAGLM